MRDMQNRERVGDWMLTSTGRQFWPIDPLEEEIDLRDISRGLAMKCRYAGQVTKFYSVAEHCVIVSYAVDPEFAREALLHDASEAYIGDMIRPLKEQPQLAGFRAVEDKLEAMIYKRFGVEITDQSRAAVKLIDTRILFDEKSIRPESPIPWAGLAGLEPLGVNVVGVPPHVAEAIFLSRFAQLFPEFAGSMPKPTPEQLEA